MSSGSVSSLANAEMNGHSWEGSVNSTPSRTQTSPAATLYPDPGGVPAVLVQPSPSPATRANSAKIKANLKGMRKVFATRGPNQMSDDGLVYSENPGRRRRMPSLNILRIPRRPMYRLRIPGRRRRSRPIPYDDSAIDGHVYEDDGINSDPEGLVDEFVELSEEDSGEGGLSAEDSQQRGDLEERLRHAELMVRRLEEENKNKDDNSPDVASPDTEDKQGSRSWTRLHIASRQPKRHSLEQWRKKRDQLSSQLKSHSTHQHHRFMSNTRRQLGTGFGKISKGLKRLRPRPKSANGEEDDVGGLGETSASVEDIHQSSTVVDYDLEEEEEDIESLRENLSELQKLYIQKSKELESTASKHEAAMADLRSQVESVVRALEGEKEKADNLHGSFVEVMELKQNEVSNLQQQLASVEKQTFERHQFLEEQLDECNNKIGQLEQFIHKQLGADLNQVPESSPLTRRLIMSIISFILLVVTTVLAFGGYVLVGGRWVWQNVFRENRFLAVLSLVVAPVTSYLLYYTLHSTTDYG